MEIQRASLAVLMAGGVVALSACVTNQTKISMLQAPEVSSASKYRSVSVARFSGPGGEVISNDLEAALMNARVQDKPVYRSVSRVGESRSLAGDTRAMVSAARSQGSDAVFAGEVIRASTNDEQRYETEYVCDQYKDPKKLFSKCVSGHNQKVACIDRKASLEVQVKFIDAATSETVFAESIRKEGKSSGCGANSPTAGHEMLSSLKEEFIQEIKNKVIPHERSVDIQLMAADEGINGENSRQQFEGAIKFATQGRFEKACDLFRNLYEAHKNSIALNYNLGVCEEANGAFWKADEHFRIADRLSTEPNKLLNAALARNGESIKKAGALARNRSDLIGSSAIEAGAAPQSIKGKAIASAAAMVPVAPADITADMLMLEKRTALVIGNSAYRRGALLNPVNDARAMASELRKANFKVIAVEDASHAKMGAAVEEFGRAIKEGGVALIFYAGHGMQVKGENYLIPVDADLKSESDVQYKTMPLGQLLAKLDQAKPRVNIVILDACRDNPFARSWRSAGSGLASVDAPAGTLIAYATAPGKVAADGAGSNGLYTSHLLKEIGRPNLKIEDVLKNTRKAVAAESNNEQIPWDSSSLTGDFYFKVSSLANPKTATAKKQ